MDPWAVMADHIVAGLTAQMNRMYLDRPACEGHTNDGYLCTLEPGHEGPHEWRRGIRYTAKGDNMAGMMGAMRDGPISNTAPNTPNSEIRALVMGLNHDLEGLNVAVSELEERLGIALIPDQPTPATGTGGNAKERAGSGLGQDIEQLRAVVDGQTRRVQALRFRVAL